MSKNLSSQTPVFIIGTGRCGSTMMSDLVHMHPDILSLSEVFNSNPIQAFHRRSLNGEAFWKHLYKASPAVKETLGPVQNPVEFTYNLDAPNSRYTLKNLPACLYMTLPHLTDDPDSLLDELEPVIRARPNAPLQNHYLFWFEWLRERMNKKMWIERSGASILMIKAMNRLFPDAKYIHISRDLRDVALSMQAFKPMRLFIHAWNLLRPFGLDIMKTPLRYSDSWIVSTFEALAVSLVDVPKRLSIEPDLELTGRFLSAMIKVGMKDLEKVPADRVYNLQYEKLVSSPQQELQAFLKFAAPDLPSKEWCEEAGKVPRNQVAKWKKLSLRDQRILTEACAPGMKVLDQPVD